MGGDQAELDRVLHATLLGDALNGASVAALLADDRGQYVAANDEACRLTGYDRRTLVAFRAGQLGADDASRRIYENVAAGDKLLGEKLVRCHDGREVLCSYWAIPTLVARLPYFILLLWAAEGRSAAAA